MPCHLLANYELHTPSRSTTCLLLVLVQQRVLVPLEEQHCQRIQVETQQLRHPSVTLENQVDSPVEMVLSDFLLMVVGSLPEICLLHFLILREDSLLYP